MPPAPSLRTSVRRDRRAAEVLSDASVDQTNGTSFSENVYIPWLYGEFRGGRMLDYIDEHSFNEHKPTCFTATYTTAHIFIEFELAVW